jgi:DNA-binding response OmpR family regulator
MLAGVVEVGVKRILVVDDEVSIAETLSIVFEDEGFACAVAGNGRVALDEARRERPDLVVLDLMMPVMDGRAMLHAMRADPELRDVPVVVMSAAPALFAELPDLPQAFLQKPFDIDAMVATAKGFLGVNGAKRASLPAQPPASGDPQA